MLHKFQDILHKLEFNTNFSATYKDSNNHLLVHVEIDPVNNTTGFIIDICQINNFEKVSDGISLYQYFVDLKLSKEQHTNQSMEELTKLFHYINMTLAVGSFNILPDNSLAFYKYNLLIDTEKETSSLEIMVKMIWLINAHLNAYTSLFTKVLKSELTFKEIIERSLLKNH